MRPQAAINALRPHFRFPLESPEARRHFLIGAALLLSSLVVPVVPALFVLGYVLQVLRRTIEGEVPEMKPWTDWGGLLRDGFRFWVVSFVTFVPGLAIMVVGFAVYFASVMAVSVSAGPEPNGSALIGVLLSLAAMFIGLAVGTTLVIAASIPFPAALAHAAAEGSLAAAFRVRQWWPIWKRNALGFVIAWVLFAGLGAAAYVGATLAYYTLVLICLIPVLLAPAYFYILLLAASISGELYAEARALRAEAS